MWCIRLRGKVKVLIEFLAMFRRVYMRKIFCICLWLSSIESYWICGTSFSVLWPRCLIWWRRKFRSMGCNIQVVYLGRGCVHLWYWNRVSVPWCYPPEIILHAWIYCGEAIGCRRVSIFVWWVIWPTWVPVFASYVSEIRFLCTCEGFGDETKHYRQPANVKDVRV